MMIAARLRIESSKHMKWFVACVDRNSRSTVDYFIRRNVNVYI